MLSRNTEEIEVCEETLHARTKTLFLGNNDNLKTS